MDQYIGNRKVMGVVEIALDSEKTPAGNQMVSVNFEDGTKETMPKMRFELIVSDTLSDASTVQETLKSKVAQYLFGALHEFGIKIGEAEGILTETSLQVNANVEKAVDIKMGFSNFQLPLNEINKIILNARQDNNGSASEGGGTDK